MDTLSTVRANLTARLVELRGRTARVEARLRQSVPSVHEGPPVDDQLMDALDQELRAEITAIEAALTRLDEGVYGLCTMCGEAIAPARLVAAPTAARCLDCAS